MERARHRSLPLTRLPSPSIAMQSRPDRRCASVLSAPAPYAVRPEPPTKTGGNTIVVFLNKTSSDPTRANDSDRPRSSRFHCCHRRRHRRRVLGRAPTDGRTDGRGRKRADPDGRKCGQGLGLGERPRRLAPRPSLLNGVLRHVILGAAERRRKEGEGWAMSPYRCIETSLAVPKSFHSWRQAWRYVWAWDGPILLI